MTNSLREMLRLNPEAAKKKIQEHLAEGKTLRELSTILGVPYPTFHRIVKDLGLLGVGRSVLADITDEDWATLNKQQIADKHHYSFSHVYNYYRYHKDEIDERIRKFKVRDDI